MALNYDKVAEEIIALIGGNDNLINITHCATRLRFILKIHDKVNKEQLKRVKGVITVIEASGQLQIVIGNHISQAYATVLKQVKIDDNIAMVAPNVGIISRLMDIISSIFAHFLYPLAACGVLQGILSLVSALGWMDQASGAYRILNFVSWAGFTFLPGITVLPVFFKKGICSSLPASCCQSPWHLCQAPCSPGLQALKNRMWHLHRADPRLNCIDYLRDSIDDHISAVTKRFSLGRSCCCTSG
ncbi:PTS system, beta-glucoside-specific IIabc component [Erwinia tracheiphila PSU-1]|nr:PTS system, beta-glucoside-specific IIabc component [Erwinia tracheiphila PSU-1]